VGWIRMKSRLNRRHGMPIEPAILFYPKYYAELGWKLMRWGWLYFRFGLKQLKVERDPNRQAYADLALSPVTDHDAEDLELFKTSDAVAWLDQQKRINDAQHGIKAPAAE
jgi:hypothetical protein